MLILFDNVVANMFSDKKHLPWNYLLVVENKTLILYLLLDHILQFITNFRFYSKHLLCENIRLAGHCIWSFI